MVGIFLIKVNQQSKCSERYLLPLRIVKNVDIGMHFLCDNI